MMVEVSLKALIPVTALVLCVTFYALLYHDQLSFVSSLPRKATNLFFWKTDPVFVSQNQSIGSKRNHTLLTLFTSMADSPLKEKPNNNTLYNWRKLLDLNVTCVLFTNNSKLGDHARGLGWIVLPILHEVPKDAGTVILPKMFQQVQKSVSSDLYGFLNGDLLLDGSLLDTIKGIIHSRILSVSSAVLSQKMLITGRRTNVPNIKPEDALSWTRLQAAAKSRGKIFMLYSEDYFITTRSYPWESYPPIAVGLRAYDNWLVLRANQLNHILIDCSYSILAVHQDTVKDGEFKNAKNNYDYNAQLLQRIFGNVNYGLGLSSCCPFETRYSSNRTVYVNKRTKTC